jgi:hypothetical protein
LHVAALFAIRHGASRNRIAFAVGKLDDDAKQVLASVGLSEYIVHGIRTFTSSSQHQGAAETSLFELFGRYAMPSDMLDPFIRPDKPPNCHYLSIPRMPLCANRGLPSAQ